MQTDQTSVYILITVRSAGCNSSGAKNIVKGATGGAFLASNASKPFCQGSAPDPTVGAYDARIYPQSDGRGNTSSQFLTPSFAPF